MTAWPLLRRAAGMKNGRALGGSEAGQLGFFKGIGGHRWDVAPVGYACWQNAARDAESPIDRVVLELQREEFLSKSREELLRL